MSDLFLDIFPLSVNKFSFIITIRYRKGKRSRNIMGQEEDS